jgi:hypothetical protein
MSASLTMTFSIQKLWTKVQKKSIDY